MKILLCNSALNCDDCLSVSGCSWCSDPGMQKHRCMSNTQGIKDCKSLQNPKSSFKILQSDPLTSSTSGPLSTFVQIRPQRIELNLRVGEEFDFDFEVSAAKDYPLDVYYLMDLSNSMTDDKTMIVKLATKLAEAFQSITKDFRIGFGSFVDKEVMPFISLVHEDNCPNRVCPQPYSFQHHMSLSEDPKAFQENVQKASISGNIDKPEGGLDALVQVLVCEKQIGWRHKARKIIIFTTDMSFHIAMDGKLGGLVRPHDGKCHLNDSGYYTHSRLQDYPSIGLINHLVQKHSAHVIWAVTEDQVPLYATLANVIAGSTVGSLSSDSSNIVKLIKSQFQDIAKRIGIQSNSSLSSLYFTSSCSEQEDEERICTNVPLGTSVTFTLHISLPSCLSETFRVTPIGLEDELLVSVTAICNCDCHSRVSKNELFCDSKACSHHGALDCGVCHCCDSYFGDTCECLDETGLMKTSIDSWIGCRSPNSSHSVLCSGRGDCICGSCVCHRPRENVVISGQYCQEICDNTACERSETGLLCSSHGKCVCGVCDCEEPWKGSDCSCKVNPEECRQSSSDTSLCSSHGICPCNECICIDEGFSGPFCSNCETCLSLCDELRPCVESLAFALNSSSRNCSFLTINEWKTFEIPYSYSNCSYKLPGGTCDYVFSIVDIHQREKPYVLLHLWNGGTSKFLCSSPEEINVVGILLGVVSAILFVGILTLCLWKALMTLHDKREYAAFEAQRHQSSFSSNYNPIFKQATTTITNPTFIRQRRYS